MKRKFDLHRSRPSSIDTRNFCYLTSPHNSFSSPATYLSNAVLMTSFKDALYAFCWTALIIIVYENCIQSQQSLILNPIDILAIFYLTAYTPFSCQENPHFADWFSHCRRIFHHRTRLINFFSSSACFSGWCLGIEVKQSFSLLCYYVCRYDDVRKLRLGATFATDMHLIIIMA